MYQAQKVHWSKWYKRVSFAKFISFKFSPNLCLQLPLHHRLHALKWFPAHGPSRYDIWYTAQDIYDVEYQQDYEPYLVMRTDIPLYITKLLINVWQEILIQLLHFQVG